MLDKLKQVEDRYEELCARAEQPDFYADPKKAAAWLREQKELAPIVAAYRAYCAAQRDMQDAAELMTGQADAELKALCQEELVGAKKRAAALEQELRVLLLPHDPNGRQERHPRDPPRRGRRGERPVCAQPFPECTASMPPRAAGPWSC